MYSNQFQSAQFHSARKQRSWTRSAQHHQLRDTPRSVAAKTAESDVWILYKNKFGVNIYMSPDRTLHWSPQCGAPPSRSRTT